MPRRKFCDSLLRLVDRGAVTGSRTSFYPSRGPGYSVLGSMLLSPSQTLDRTRWMCHGASHLRRQGPFARSDLIGFNLAFVRPNLIRACRALNPCSDPPSTPPKLGSQVVVRLLLVVRVPTLCVWL